MSDKPKAAAIGSKRSQFIASVRIATRKYDQGGTAAECVRSIKQALKVLDKE